MILTADWHLVDAPSEEYRWEVFENLQALIAAAEDKEVFILGDLCDRKDKHSATLVNRLVNELKCLMTVADKVHIIMGNHDIPLSGTPFWNILNEIEGVHFYWKPATMLYGGKRIAVLPFSSSPETDWESFIYNGWKGIDMVFMHQPINGVVMENGSLYSHAGQLPIPADIPVVSGDIHTPQTVGNVVYVGAPHVVKFGDMYKCRMMQLYKHTVRMRKFYFPNPHRKWIVRGSSVAEMKAQYGIMRGHQVKVEFLLPIDEVDRWPGIQVDLQQWAKDVDFDLVSTEVEVEMGASTVDAAEVLFSSYSDELRAFAKQEGLRGEVLRVGLSIIEVVA